MWRLCVALCILVGMVHPTFADSAKIRLSFALDWSKLHDQEALASKLEAAGLLPLPMIFVQGKLRGLVPSRLDVERTGTPTEINIGVAQILERPLYVIQVEQSVSRGVTAQVAWLDLSVVENSDLVKSQETTVVLRGINHSKLETSSRDGVTYLVLPAAPMAALATFASKTGDGMAEGHFVSLVLQENKRYDPPLLQLLNNGIKKGNFDLNTSLESAPAKAQADYTNVVQLDWLYRWYLPLKRKIFSSLSAPLPSPLILHSHPRGALVYLDGSRYQDKKTNTEVEIIQELWDDISLRLKQQDCVVDPSMATVPPGTNGPPIFNCNF